jgi:hypothetical protein
MYLARLPENSNGCRYLIRQSYADGNCYRSRDLFDLGDDPSRFIVYVGGNGFYIDPAWKTPLPIKASLSRRTSSRRCSCPSCPPIFAG